MGASSCKVRPSASGSSLFRRHIATEAVKPGAGIAVLREAAELVRDAPTDLASIAA